MPSSSSQGTTRLSPAGAATRHRAAHEKHHPRARELSDFFGQTAEQLSDEVLALAIDVERKRLVAQSALFATLSSELLLAAVSSHAGTNRVAFEAPWSGPENAFAAPWTWLWDGVDDPVYGTRLAAYAEHFEWPIVTPLASMCHPNVAGSRAYATAVEKCLTDLGVGA